MVEDLPNLPSSASFLDDQTGPVTLRIRLPLSLGQKGQPDEQVREGKGEGHFGLDLDIDIDPSLGPAVCIVPGAKDRERGRW